MTDLRLQSLGSGARDDGGGNGVVSGAHIGHWRRKQVGLARPRSCLFNLEVYLESLEENPGTFNTASIPWGAAEMELAREAMRGRNTVSLNNIVTFSPSFALIAAVGMSAVSTTPVATIPALAGKEVELCSYRGFGDGHHCATYAKCFTLSVGDASPGCCKNSFGDCEKFVKDTACQKFLVVSSLVGMSCVSVIIIYQLTLNISRSVPLDMRKKCRIRASEPGS